MLSFMAIVYNCRHKKADDIFRIISVGRIKLELKQTLFLVTGEIVERDRTSVF